MSDYFTDLRDSLRDAAAREYPTRTTRPHGRSLWARMRLLPVPLAAGVGIALAAGTGLAATIAISGDPFAGPAEPAPSHGEIAKIARAYPVLSRAQNRSDVPPGRLLDIFLVHEGAVRANVRRALVTSWGESIYLVPADRQLCYLTSDNVADGCGTFPDTHPNRLLAVGTTLCSPGLPRDEVETIAILPPQARRVTIGYSNGQAHPITASSGVVALRARKGRPLPRYIRWTAANGPERSPTGIGASSYSTAGKCAG